MAGLQADRRCRGGELGQPSDRGQERPLFRLLLETQSHWHRSFREQPCQPAPAQHRAGWTDGGEERRGAPARGEAMAGRMEGAGGWRGRAGVPLPGLDEIR